MSPLTSSGASNTDQAVLISKEEVFPREWEPLENCAKNLEMVGRNGHIVHDGESAQLGTVLRITLRAVRLPIVWLDTQSGGFNESGIYVVQTTVKVVQRCILMTTDPGDLVLDPTCGSGTTAYVAEQWGRRWITIDTSRVACFGPRPNHGCPLPLLPAGRFAGRPTQRSRNYSHGTIDRPTRGDIRQGFVYERVPHITLKSIANNAEIDVIWEKFQEKLEPLRQKLNKALGKKWEEWEIPPGG